MITYGEVVEAMKKSSMTQVVALFTVVVGECVKKGCFQPGGMNHTIARIENRIAKEKGKDIPNPEVEPKIMKFVANASHHSLWTVIIYIVLVVLMVVTVGYIKYNV